MNLDPESSGLSLNITENDNRLDPDLALEAAPFFRVGHREGKEIIAKTGDVATLWPTFADRYGIPSFEKELMSRAFKGRQ